MTKKITSFLMAFIMLIVCSAGATVSYADDNTFTIDSSEMVLIDGKEYKYEEILTDGKEIIHVINLTDNTEDILYYDTEKSTVFLNDMPIAYIEKVSEDATGGFENFISPLATNGWRYHDTSNHRITWVQGVTAAVLAGIIAAVIPGTGKLAVLAKIGATTLGIVAGACAGGTVKCVAYTQVLLDGKVQFRYDWTFKPSTGESYGPYSSYQL